MKTFSGLVISIMLLGFTACSPSNQYDKELAQIDSCLVVLDSIENQFNGIEFDSLKLMVDHVLMNEDSLKKYYKPDTLSTYIGTRMTECKGIRKTMQSLEMKENNFRTEIDAQKKQFSDLRSDIEEGVLTQEKINEYLDKELISLAALNESFSQFYYMQSTNKRYYYFSVPVIDSLIVVLKNEYIVE